MSTSMRGKIILFLKGMAMGVADSVPGVSGGTIAVISGIYEPLINALRRCNPMALSVLWHKGPAEFWRSIHGPFLLTLGMGILLSLLLMANTVLYLLDNHRIQVMTFFMGLVLASCWLLRREAGVWNVATLALFILGFILTAATAVLNPAAGSESLIYVFFSAMVAICAMILPGISGAFILILLGVYEPVLDALRSFNLSVVLVFAAGCAIGLLSFSHLLAWTFHYYRKQTYAILTGMLAASLIVLWPGTDAVLSSTVAEQLAALCLFVVGAAVISLFARLTRQTQS